MSIKSGDWVTVYGGGHAWYVKYVNTEDSFPFAYLTLGPEVKNGFFSSLAFLTLS